MQSQGGEKVEKDVQLEGQLLDKPREEERPWQMFQASCEELQLTKDVPSLPGPRKDESRELKPTGTLAGSNSKLLKGIETAYWRMTKKP